MAKSPNHNKHVFIVKKFCKKPINWAKNVKMAQQIFNQFPDIEFWDNLKKLELDDLSYFLSDYGRAFLANEWKMYKLKLPEKKTYELEENIIDKFKVKDKPKSLIEFLRKYDR